MNKRLREQRLLAGLSQSHLAKIAGVSLKSQGAYERGERFPDSRYLEKISTKLDVNYIITGKKEHEIKLKSKEHTNNVVLIPKLDVDVSAGFGGNVSSEHTISHVPIDIVKLKNINININEARFVTVAGDSMNDTFINGDVVLVDPSQNHTFCEGVWIIRINDNLLIKRIISHEENGILICSDNKMYPNKHVLAKDMKNVKFIAPVIAVNALRVL